MVPGARGIQTELQDYRMGIEAGGAMVPGARGIQTGLQDGDRGGNVIVPGWVFWFVANLGCVGVLNERANQANPNDFKKLLGKVPDTEPESSDKL